VILKLKRTPGIYLVRFMGSGKSTIGRLLAEEIGWSFIDLDDEIEKSSGLSISALFELNGEAEFRRIEHQTLQRFVQLVESGKPFVVALGGGAFAQQKNYDLLENNGVTIWLDCPLPLLERRVARHEHRPLARDIEKFRSLFQQRQESYAKADYRVEVSDAEPILHVSSILRLPLFA